jgi:hypothetical protein
MERRSAAILTLCLGLLSSSGALAGTPADTLKGVPAPSNMSVLDAARPMDPQWRDNRQFAYPPFEKLKQQALEARKSSAFDTQVTLCRALLPTEDGKKSAAGVARQAFQEVFGKDLELSFEWLSAQENRWGADGVSSRGAHRYYQMRPTTAREYGYDPVEDTSLESAATAAARYLKYLIGHFKGVAADRYNATLMALAAYNCGKECVDRKISRLQSPRRVYFDEIRNQLPRQTQEFVPSALAWMEVGRDPERHGFHLERIQRRGICGELRAAAPVSPRLASNP